MVRRTREGATTEPLAARESPVNRVVAAVIFGEGVLQALSPCAGWAQMSTIGVAEPERIAARTVELRPDVRFVDAPVSGSRGPAGTGQLLILLAKAKVDDQVKPARWGGCLDPL